MRKPWQNRLEHTETHKTSKTQVKGLNKKKVKRSNCKTCIIKGPEVQMYTKLIVFCEGIKNEWITKIIIKKGHHILVFFL
jgi:Pyruvate/2-oxoacid:ferredoxin oxidoreductase delta subunit